MVELRVLTFENINRTICLKPKYYQQKFVEKVADTI